VVTTNGRLVYHTVEVINGGDVVGLQVGANPHVWYSARYVDAIRAAMLSKLEQLAPRAAAYFDAQSAALDQQFATYYSVINVGRGLCDGDTAAIGWQAAAA
jgi:ABC-type Zn uptake system ZnuABC Zn-binding protein ZnuA